MTEIWNSAATTPAATHRVPVDRSSSSSPAHWTGQQIADVRAYIGETVNSLGSISTNQSLSLADGRYIAATIAGNVQFTFTSVPAGATEIFLELTDGGAHTVSFAASLTWTGGTVPSLPASGVALLHLRTRDGGTTYLANMVSDEQSFDAAAVTSGVFATARLGSGSASSSTFLRGDQTWASPIGGSSGQLIYNSSGVADGASGTHWDVVNGRLSIGAGTSPAGMLHAQASAASVIPAVLQGAASQTANLQEWRNSAGTVLSRIASNGVPYFGNAKIETDRFYPYATNDAWFGQAAQSAHVFGASGVIFCTSHPDLADVKILPRTIQMGINGAYQQQTFAGWDHDAFDYGAAGSLLIRPGAATTKAAPTYITGAALMLAGGAAASQAAGAAHGGALNLDGGQGYGTGSHGNVVIGATRGNLEMSDARNIQAGTTTGTKIGTATTQKLGFWNAAPVVQPAAVADATDATTVITQLNDLLAKLRTVGLIAT